MNRLIDPAFELELLNGDGLITGVVFLVCIGVYLRAELRDRRLGVQDWLHFRLPSHINFALAVAVCDAGICLRAGAIWFWRRWLGAGEMPLWLFAVLMVGALLIIVGGLCKIRSLSYPFELPYTHITVWPWAATLGIILTFMAASIYFH
jgi:hypothetical protein